MLDHADRQLAPLIAFLEQTDMLANTIVIVTSDNGASQEGGPLRRSPQLQDRALQRETRARIDEIGGPKTHTNFPLGWAMAANTPLRRYKQNTHGGGIRDPLVLCWLDGVTAPPRHRQLRICRGGTGIDRSRIEAPCDRS